MSARLPRPLRRLTHPRSRRASLWACVYCGVYDDAAAESDGTDPARPAD